jgi:hypothetical protein
MLPDFKHYLAICLDRLKKPWEASIRRGNILEEI